MNFNEPTPDYYWKISLFGPFNLCMMVAQMFTECIEFKFSWIYILLQDVAMWIEFRQVCSGVNWRELTFARARRHMRKAGWTFNAFIISFFGAHIALISQHTVTRPEYCKDVLKRLGYK